MGLVELIEVLPAHIIENTRNIPFPLSDFQDKLIWNYTTDGEFSIKTAT